MDEDERIHLWPDQGKLERSIPLNRLGTPEDIALAVLYLGLAASS
jgi:NAD(P)-dependent dehydrogenase (short-subunit alcohol dehydrogenase family)